MTDLICRKTMMRCQTQGMCAPFGGCQPSVLADCKTAQSNSRDTPSPAGVDGLEVAAWATFNKDYKDSGQLHYTEREARKRIQFLEFIATCDAEPLCRLSDAQAIIDGLRGEVAALQSMITDLSKTGIRMRVERDNQARRAGELEAALEFACKSLAQVTSSDGSGHADIAVSVLRMAGRKEEDASQIVEAYKAGAKWRIDAALSAGKEGK